MEKLQTKATLRRLRVAPRKVRLLIDLIRGMEVGKAIEQLQFSKKHAAKPVLKLLKSAIANAGHNHQIKPETLVIKTAYVDGGATLHRWIPRAMGRATPIRKRTSHITLILEGEVDEKLAKKVKAEAKKENKDVEKHDHKEKKVESSDEIPTKVGKEVKKDKKVEEAKEEKTKSKKKK